MKFKHCPDCGAEMKHTRSDCGWGEDYDCPACGLNISIQHGETMHAEPDQEKWTRKESQKKKGGSQ